MSIVRDNIEKKDNVKENPLKIEVEQAPFFHSLISDFRPTLSKYLVEDPL